MDESAVNLGVWLAGGEAKMTVGRDSLNVLVIGARSMRELGELLTPLAKRLSNGLVCSSSFTITTNQSGEPALSTKIRIKQLPFGSWDLVLFAPRYCETIPPRELKQSVVFALQKCKVGPSTRLVLALPTNVDFHPVQLRTRMCVSPLYLHTW
ncbi:hypothetical protein BASA81_001123 [Batrachochytrium salamandrivorans]|nr:hypothetical protein BASA81_001123 [Batrachochytrium salamandrivorans]